VLAGPVGCKSTGLVRAGGSGRVGLGDEDAERVPGRVGVHVQRLLRVVGAVEQEPRPQGLRPLVRGVEVGDRRDAEVEVQLLRDRAVRPGRGRQLGDG
jgi:hypothetical protein